RPNLTLRRCRRRCMGGWTTVHRVQRAHLALCGPEGQVLVHCGHMTILAGMPRRSSEVGYTGGVEFFTPGVRTKEPKNQRTTPTVLWFFGSIGRFFGSWRYWQ